MVGMDIGCVCTLFVERSHEVSIAFTSVVDLSDGHGYDKDADADCAADGTETITTIVVPLVNYKNVHWSMVRLVRTM